MPSELEQDELRPRASVTSIQLQLLLRYLLAEKLMTPQPRQRRRRLRPNISVGEP